MENNINTEISALTKKQAQKKEWQTPELKKTSVERATENGGAPPTTDGVMFS
jgi:hypothetical protein